MNHHYSEKQLARAVRYLNWRYNTARLFLLFLLLPAALMLVLGLLGIFVQLFRGAM